jgi:hypothetical protein
MPPGDGRQGGTQILGMTSAPAEKPAERPERGGQRLQVAGSVVLALWQNKVQQNPGFELVQWPLRSFGPVLRVQKQANKERPLLAGARLEPGNVYKMFLVVLDQMVDRRC